MNATPSGDNSSELPIAEFAFPGPLRDRLVEAILDGRKVTTTSLALEYEDEREALPIVGGRSVVVDSHHRPVCIIETLEVRVVRLGDVSYEHVEDEGEGDKSVAEWRAGHERFWRSKEMSEVLGGSILNFDDATLVVLERFRVVEKLR